MQVRLKKAWFAPDGTKYVEGVHEFSDGWKDELPSSAEIIVAVPADVDKPVTSKSTPKNDS